MSPLLRLISLLLLACCSAENPCPGPNLIHCKNVQKCVRIQYLCDGDNDCGDLSDEEPSFCQAWKNPQCERNSVQCTRNGKTNCILIPHFCQFIHSPCEESLDPKICQVLKNGILQDLGSVVIDDAAPPTSIHYDIDSFTSEFNDKMDYTLRNEGCPFLFTKVEDQCVSIFNIGTLNWIEARTFCQEIGGDLLTINKDLSNFYFILQHFRGNNIGNDFWIGGSYNNETFGWKWVDNTDIQVGSPIWAIKYTAQCKTREYTSIALNVTVPSNDGYCYHYSQAPTASEGQCAFMSYEHFFYLSNDRCTARKSFICVQKDSQAQ